MSDSELEAKLHLLGYTITVTSSLESNGSPWYTVSRSKPGCGAWGQGWSLMEAARRAGAVGSPQWL